MFAEYLWVSVTYTFSLSCIGEGNGNPLQCSCLENPRDRGAWWASVSGVAQSRTQLKRLSSSSRKNDFLVSVLCLLFIFVFPTLVLYNPLWYLG